MNTFYSIDISSGWVLLVVVLASILALFLYSKKGVPWQKNTNLLLGFLRFTFLLLIGLLLINPIIKQSINEPEVPSFIFAYDNSSSIQLRTDSSDLTDLLSRIDQVKNELSSTYNVDEFDFNGKLEEPPQFNFKTSNLASFLKGFENRYEGKNVGALVLFSDGIYNEGISPAFLNYRYPIYCIGLGDTIPPKDLSIASVRNNRVAYQGNKFPVHVEIEQNGFNGETTYLSIKDSEKEWFRKRVNLNQPLIEEDMQLPASSPGLKHLIVSLETMEGESTTLNNTKDIYIDIIEGKETILITSPSPHPDIHAIRDVLEETGSYETSLYIPSITDLPLEKEYDVIIQFQAFSNQQNQNFTANGTWYIIGNKTNLARLNKEIPYLKIQQKGSQKDIVRPAFNSTFHLFEIKSDQLDKIKSYPPIEVFFGDYNLSGPTHTLLFQKVGSVQTSKPLLSYYDDGSTKSAIMLGNGLWQWKLQEAALNGHPDLFNEIILKTVQYLSIKTDKKRFAVTPRQNVYKEGDRIFLDAQYYNDIYERSYGNKILLKVTNEGGETRNYELIDSPLNSAFNIGSLPQGIYQYEASLNTGNQMMTDQGEFLVQALQIEAVDLKADHNLLREIASKSWGRFYHRNDLDEFQNDLIGKDFKSIIRTHESFFPLIKSLWIIFLILGLALTEWFLRKYLGSY